MIICFPHPPGAGGPGTFQRYLEEYFIKTGWAVCYKGSKCRPDLIFVVGGTRHLTWLIFMKLKKIPVLYRLDGIPWLHRFKKVKLRKYVHVELGIFICKLIHAFLADYIVYQSEFVKKWWEKAGWRKRKNYSVIYNGVKLPLVSDDKRVFNGNLVVLEGNIDYSPYAVKLLNDLAEMLPVDINIHLYGNFENKSYISLLDKRITYHGYIHHDHITKILSGSIYLSLDINPACPNTVLEAMACGAPVAAFCTGSLSEIVTSEAGILVPYGSDPWKLNYPDVYSLIKAIIEIKNNYVWYSVNARKKVEEQSDLEITMNKYLAVIKNIA